MHTTTLLLTALTALGYLAVLRLVDVNEKEPLWAIGMLFVLGAGAAVVLRLVGPDTGPELEPVAGALGQELARFLAVGAGVAALGAVARYRGFSELNGLMDGVVYGAAAGLGAAVGAAVLATFRHAPGELASALVAAPVASVGRAAVAGLAEGVFGALLGVGFAAAVHARRTPLRVVFVVAGFAAAALAHVGYALFAFGDALGGDGARVRAWVALALPVLCVGAVALFALLGEKRAILSELAAEVELGVVGSEDVRLLGSYWRREALYLGTLLRGRFAAALRLRTLHNRVVQLALAKRRAAADPVA
ncbi:MAG: PrsW family intramembrane metalloprotease, partial [Myxococcales bacterium]|nr:PrsW family intramembrane metalloprotease [Myxococcales bacterium]